MIHRSIAYLCIRRVRSRLASELRSPSTQHLAVTFVGKLGRFSLGFVASIIMARALGPDAYGLIALISVVLAVADTVGDFGLTYAAIRAVSRYLGSEPNRARRLAHCYFSLSFAANIAAAIVGFTFAEPIARMMLGRPEAEPYLRLALLGLISVAGSGFTSALLMSTRRFGGLAALDLLTSSTYLAGIIALTTFEQMSVASVVLLGAVNPLVGFVVGLRLLPPGFVALHEAFALPARATWEQLVGFGKWMWLWSFLGLLGSQLDLIILGHFAPTVIVGVYALAFNLAMKLDVVNQARLTVLLPTVSSLQTKQEMGEYVRRSLIRSILLAIGFVIAMPLFPSFIVTFYGPAYSGAVEVLIVLTIVAIFDLATTPLSLLSFPLDRPQALAALDAIRVVALLVSGFVLIPSLGPIGAALARLISRVIGTAFIALIVVRKMRGEISSHSSAGS